MLVRAVTPNGRIVKGAKLWKHKKECVFLMKKKHSSPTFLIGEKV